MRMVASVAVATVLHGALVAAAAFSRQVAERPATAIDIGALVRRPIAPARPVAAIASIASAPKPSAARAGGSPPPRTHSLPPGAPGPAAATATAAPPATENAAFAPPLAAAPLVGTPSAAPSVGAISGAGGGSVGAATAEGAGGDGRGGGAGASLGGGSGDRGPSGRDSALALLAARIRAHRRYPELARRRGLEGTVLLRFSVRPDGGVAGLEIVDSADPALDEAAREAVLAAAPLPPVDGTVTLPMPFRLREHDER